MHKNNWLYFGDNLRILREHIASESVDLIYLDPPFNSKADYNILYGTRRAGASESQSHAFDDMWKWGKNAQRALDEAAARNLQAGSLLDSFQRVFPNSNMMAYLAMMAVRLIELHRVLKPTGSLYLHCDPTASHYLKILLDAIFGSRRFGAEIIWKRTSAHSDAGQGRRLIGFQHDVIFQYMKSDEYVWNNIYHAYGDEYAEKTYRHKEPQTGRRYGSFDITAPGGANPQKRNPHYEFLGVTRYWRFSEDRMKNMHSRGLIIQAKPGAVPRQKRYLDEMPGVPLQSLWTDINPIGAQAQERLGYPTPKPLALLERIISISSNKGDLVLDPFCGCGTAIEAAQRLERRWIGIDITVLAIHVIEARLTKVFGPEIIDAYESTGRPKDSNDARVLAARDWLEFQKWAVMTLGGLPKDRPGADAGIDGIIRYHRVGIEQPNRAIVSVKGGTNVGVDAIHKLKSVVHREKAELGVLVCLDRPTAAMVKEAASEGEVGPKSRRVSKIQIITVDMLFRDDAVRLPGMLDPPEAVPAGSSRPKTARSRKRIEGQAEMLFPISDTQYPKAAEPRTSRAIRPVDTEVVRPQFSKRTRRN